MRHNASIVATFDTHEAADDGIDQLATAGFDTRSLSVVATGHRTEEQVVGFYSAGDRVRFWGKLGCLWGGFWGVVIGGVLFAVPAADGFEMFGFLGDALVAAAEGALIIGGIAALGAAIYSFGRPVGSVLKYGSVATAGTYLIVAKGRANAAAFARQFLPPKHSAVSVGSYTVSGGSGGGRASADFSMSASSAARNVAMRRTLADQSAKRA